MTELPSQSFRREFPEDGGGGEIRRGAVPGGFHLLPCLPKRPMDFGIQSPLLGKSLHGPGLFGSPEAEGTQKPPLTACHSQLGQRRCSEDPGVSERIGVGWIQGHHCSGPTRTSPGEVHSQESSIECPIGTNGPTSPAIARRVTNSSASLAVLRGKGPELLQAVPNLSKRTERFPSRKDWRKWYTERPSA